MDYDLDSETRMLLYEEKQQRILRQRQQFCHLADGMAGLSLVTMVVALAYLLG